MELHEHEPEREKERKEDRWASVILNGQLFTGADYKLWSHCSVPDFKSCLYHLNINFGTLGTLFKLSRLQFSHQLLTLPTLLMFCED